MKRFLSRRWVKPTAGILFALLLATLAAAYSFRIWSWRDFRDYLAMSHECHTVWKDLHYGDILPGQDVEAVITTTTPVDVERFGEFVRVNYQRMGNFTGVTITAKNGRVVSASAWSCMWDRLFFDELTEQDWKSFADARTKYWQEIQKKRTAEEKRAAADPGGVR